MIHDVREHFLLEDFLSAREKTISLVDDTISSLEEGMGEADCLELIEGKFISFGVTKKWHPPKFRIGKDTLKSFSEKSEHHQKLTPGEIFFIDIGPVWDGYEGDFGKTFVFGDDLYGHQKLADSAQDIFHKTAQCWRENSTTGSRLYDYAREYSAYLGLELNEKMSGHRIGDFPHHLFYRGTLGDISETPVENLWVLEILIEDPKMNRGAFFEDILTKN